MHKDKICSILMCFENTIDELYILDSILKITKEACLKRDISLCQDTFTPLQKIALSEERNHYINLLTLAQDKVDLLKNSIMNIESNVGCL